MSQFAQRLIPHRLAAHTLSLVGGMLLLLLSIAARADSGGETLSFADYDHSLYDQVVHHIKEKVGARLGKGRNEHDRFFIIPFAYQNKRNQPEFSHSFLSVIRVFADGRQPSPTKGLAVRSYQNRAFEAFTISWLPNDFLENPHLCVFDGFGARLIPSWNKCPVSPGKDFKLPETLSLATRFKLALAMWGPYEITRGAFDLAVKRLRLLDSGTIKYRADDRGYRKDRVAINCFHAMAGLEELFPNGGLFGTGFKMWGFNGTARVLIEYKSRATKEGLLLEPVNVKDDVYGFVYVPERDGKAPYNPFRQASAYQK